MSKIENYLKQILSAVYGKDVRQSIYNAIAQCYDDVSNPTLSTEALKTTIEARIQELLDDGSLANMTIADGSITAEKLADDIVFGVTEVTEASAMTDTNAIYLYKGSEEGYSYGSLYYNNGNKWMDVGGGQVTSSKIADEAINYNHIKMIEYEGEPTEDIAPEATVINLFDLDTMVFTGKSLQANGTLDGWNGTYIKMPITGGKTYCVSKSDINFNSNALALWDSDGNPLFAVSEFQNYLINYIGNFKRMSDGTKVSSEMEYRKDGNGKGLTFKTTEECAYLLVAVSSKTDVTLASKYMVEEGNLCHDYVAYDSSGSGTPDISEQGNLEGCEITGLFGASLSDNYARKNISTLTSKVNSMTGLSDDAVIKNGIRKFGYTIEPAINDIPTVYANGESFADMTTDKNEVVMSFKYISKTDVFGGWMKIKYQGNLSLWFDKKNFSVKLYADKNLERKMKVDLKGWGLQNKFVWKANYVDRSHARNIVSARLWSDIVASRPTYDARMMYSPNHGAVDGFPFRLYVNGEYYGLMTWNIPKDGWMAEMTEDNINHCILCAELNGTSGTSSCDFASNYTSSAWSIEFPDEMLPKWENSFNDIINCVVNDTDEDFKANIDSHLDIYSALDYYLFFYLNGGTDSLAKNMLLFTYDGVKWYCGAYDMDGVWGRDAVSSSLMGTELQCPEQYINTNSLLWKRVEACFGQELRDRYFELRETILSKEYIMAKFHQFVDQIPEDVYAEDVAKNGMKGVYGTEFLNEVNTWLDGRFTYVDAEMEAMVTV